MTDGYRFKRPAVMSPNSGWEDGDARHNAAIDQHVHDQAGADKPMDQEQFEGVFAAEYARALDWNVINGIRRAEAVAAYRRDPYEDDDNLEGRSRVITSEVEDSVKGIHTPMMRTLSGSEFMAKFLAQNAASVGIADQMTAYVNYVWWNDNDNQGYRVLDAWLKNALKMAVGVVKWRWSEDFRVTETAFTGLPAEMVLILADTPDTKIVELVQCGSDQDALYTANPDPDSDAALLAAGLDENGQPIRGTGIDGDQPEPVPAEQPQPAPVPMPGDPAQTAQPQPPATYDCRIRRKIKENRLVVENLSPEDWLINPDATDANSERGYTFQAHKASKTVSDIVAMGYDRDEILEHAYGAEEIESNVEKIVRNPFGQSMPTSTSDESMLPVLFIEAYMRVDRDGDGFAELRKIHAVGNGFHILHDEIIDQAPFAYYCPDPEPGTVTGSCPAFQVMDLQRIQSNMLRNTLDSAANAVHSRTAFNENSVYPQDIMNTKQGAQIRIKNNIPAAQAIVEFNKPFIGQQILPLMQRMDEIKAARTGISPAAQGLSPDLLQSTEKSAVTATVSGAQEQIAQYIRIFAEGPAVRLFRGMANTLREHQDGPREFELLGKRQTVDPRSWIGDLQCIPNVDISQGTVQDRLQRYGAILQEQKWVASVLGSANPVAGADRIRATQAKMVELAGEKDASAFFGEVTPQYLQQLEQAQQNPPPNPLLIDAQAAQMKVQQDGALHLLKFHQEQYEFDRKMEQEERKIRMDTMAKLAVAEMQYPGQNPNQALIDSLLDDQQRMAEIHADHRAALHKNMMDARAAVIGHHVRGQTGIEQAQIQADAQQQAPQGQQ